MSTNIKGLDSLVNAIQGKIDKVDGKVNALDIRGGDGILVTRLGENKFVISKIDKTGGNEESYPWHINIIKSEDSDDEYIVSTNAGTINGYLPDNYDNIGTVTEGSGLQYVYAVAETNLYGLLSLTLELRTELTDTNRKFDEEKIPTGFDLLIGIISDRFVMKNLYKYHLQAMPDIAYQIPNESALTGYTLFYTWSINEDN
jgi:hypothetical protein